MKKRYGTSWRPNLGESRHNPPRDDDLLGTLGTSFADLIQEVWFVVDVDDVDDETRFFGHTLKRHKGV